jgi:hypothetical protein
MKKWLWSIAMVLFAPLMASAADIAIPPQPLGTSLQQLARQCGIQIIFFSKVVEGHDAPALNGTFTPQAALDKLLAGTNLTHHSLNDRTIEVAPKPVVATMPWTPLPGPKPEDEASSDAPLQEVEITAERTRLSQMRAEIARLEQQFYARYNQANTNRQYDIVLCRSLTYTGSHVERQLCAPAAVAPAPAGDLGRYADVGLYKVPYLDDSPPSIKTPTDAAELRAYQQNMVEVVRKHPELLELVKRRNALVERYLIARKQKSGTAQAIGRH